MSAARPPVAETVPADDRGLAYGDGLFETMRVEQGGIPLLDRHLDRLLDGCGRIGLPSPPRETVANEARAAAAGVGQGVVKLVLTRGSGGRGYRPPDNPRPRIIVSTHSLPAIPREWYRLGVRVQLCSTRIGRSAATAGLKSLGRLEQVLASAELDDDAAEGLMLDEQGHLIEGTHCNLFLCEDDSLVTPRLDMSGVAGVMRSLVLEIAVEERLRAREEPVDLERLKRAGEIFLTNSVVGVLPVRRVAGTDWRGQPGPATRRIMEEVGRQGIEAWAP